MTSRTDQETIALDREGTRHVEISTSSAWAGWWVEEND